MNLPNFDFAPLKLLGDCDLVYTEKSEESHWNGWFLGYISVWIRGTLLIFEITKEICNMFVIYLGSLDLGHDILPSSSRAILKNDVASQVNDKYVHPKNLNVVSRCSSVISIQWPLSNSLFRLWKANQAWNILQCAKHLCAPFSIRVNFACLNVFLIYIVWKTNVHR